MEFNVQDGQVLIQAIQDAARNPVKRDFDRKKYLAEPKKYERVSKRARELVKDERTKPAPVEAVEQDIEGERGEITHEEIQHLLLTVGAEMGLDVWVARNDRNKEFKGQTFKDIQRMRDELPAQFDRKTMNIIENIDVIWLRGDTFVAAFEVEHTTQIYSSLLRLSDLVAKHPNLKIDLYIVAPDERKDKVSQEIGRPTFEKLPTPLREICRFLPYSKLKDEVARFGSRTKFVRPDFVREIAEEFLGQELR